jgi:hypothetical protein
MARNTSNRLIEQLDPGSHRDVPNNAPAVETANARVDIIGPFRQVQVAANQSAVALSTGISGTDGQPGIIAHSAGKILGMTYSFNAAVTAGGATAAQLQATVAPAATLTAAAQGDVVAVASQASPRQAATIDQSADILFNKGDAIGVNLSTSGTFAPTTVDVDVFLIVRWAASPGVPA